MKVLEGDKIPKDLEKVTRAIEDAAPNKANPSFQKKLREQLMAKHKTVAMEAEEVEKPADKNVKQAKGKSKKSGSSQKHQSEGFNPLNIFGGSPFKGWAFASVILIVLIVSGAVTYPFIPAPQVEGYSLKENVREISYNAPIKIVFTQPMDQGSVENAFHIEPRVNGEIKWQGNTMLFVPETPFEVGERYAVYVEKEAKSLLQKQMPYGYEETFQISGPPQVILFNPADGSENIDIKSKITVMFDRPMTALQSLDDGEANMPEIKIEPKAEGRFKWLGTSSIQFIPEKLNYSTAYTVTVPEGTESAEGGKTDSNFVSSFTTITPRLINTTPYDGFKFNGPETNVRLDFNQPMNLDKADKNISWYVYKGDDQKIKNLEYSSPEVARGFSDESWNKVNFKARYLTIEDLKKEAGVDVEFNEEDINKEALNNSILMESDSKLDFDSVYFVKISKELKGAEGEFTLPEESALIFKTVGKLTVTNTDPPDGVDLETYKDKDYGRSYSGRLNWVDVDFSHPLLEDQEFGDFVIISPEKKDSDGESIKPTVSLGYAGTNLSIGYPFDPSSDYSIDIKAGLKDPFGQQMEEAYSFGFKTAPLAPALDLAESSDISILDANKAPVYYLKSTNIDYADFNFKKLSDEEFRTVYSGGYVSSKAEQALTGPFTSWKKSLEEKFNEKVTTKIDLAQETGQALEPGIYYFDAYNPTVSNRYGGDIYKERQVFVYTYSALAVKRTADEMLVWATALNDGSPISGMNISVLTNEGDEVASGVTDANGLASIDLPKKEVNADDKYVDYYPDDYTVIGRKGSDMTISHSTWSEGIAPWNFNIDYSLLQAEYYVYSYTDRPIYRPGHSVYYKGLVRKDEDARFALPTGQKVHVVVEDSQGEIILEKDHELNSNGTFNGEITLSDKARTGNYRIITSLPDVQAPEYMNRFTQTFLVAEYRKPDYELKIEADKDDYINGDTAKLEVKGAYFFGAPMPDAKIEWTVKSQDYYFFLSGDSESIYANKWFSFSDQGYFCYWGCESDSEVVSSGKANLDESGIYTIELPLDISEKEMSQFYTVEVTAYDLNNQSVSNRITVPVHAGEYYVGILNEDYIVSTGDKAKFEVVSVDFEGNPVGGKDVEVSYNKRTWNTVKKKNVDGGFYYENTYTDDLIEKKSVRTDDKGYAQVEFDAKDGGSFHAVAESKDGKGNTIKASTSVYVSSGDFINWGMENNDRIELVADKLEYKPGETAHILVKSPYENVWALVTQERNGILDHDVIKIKSNSDTIDVPITEDSIPNLFVSVILVKGSEAEAGLLEPPLGANDERSVAAFKAGYTALQVDNSSKELDIEVKTDMEKYHPGDDVTIKVKTLDQNGDPVKAEVSLSVVDKSVLSLTETVTADLLNAFYRKRMLGVATAHTLTKAISRINVQVEAGLKGGGGASPEKRGTFKDTAHFEADLETDENGEGEITFKLPDNLTTWEILAIGITDDTLVGSQKSDFLVTKDVLVRPVLPRFLIKEDTMKIGGIVHNYLDNEETFKVKLDATGVEFINGSQAEKTITLGSGKEEKVTWDIKVLNQTEATFLFDVRSVKDESIGDILEQKLTIEPFSFPEVVATSLTIDDSKKHIETVWLPNNIDTNFGELTVSVSPTLTGSIGSGLEYLMRFPYGCAEQTASALLPNLVLKQLMDLPTVDDDLVDVDLLEKNVESGIQDLYKYQQSNGGWGIWETSDPTPYLTSYILYTLHEADKAGYTVDNEVISRGKKYLTNYMSGHALTKTTATDSKEKKYDSRRNANARAYGLYVLAETGSPDLGLTNNLYEFKDELNLFSKAYLVMTFNELLDGMDGSVASDIRSKMNTLTDEILAKAKENPRGVHFEEDENLYYMFDTNTRTTAIILQMLSRVEPDHPYVPKILRHLLIEKKDGHFASTQETAVSLIAMLEYIVSSGELDASYNAAVGLNGKELINESFTGENISEQKIAEIALNELQANNQDNEMTFERNGSGKMYVDMNLKYYLPAEEIKPRDEGILVTHEYYSVDDENMENPVSSVKLGETLRGKITVIVPEDSYYVMVEDYLPAGLEGVDFSLKTSKQSLQDDLYESRNSYGWWYYDSSWWFNHKEVRDDRMMYFADYLPKGVYELNYFVRATTPGQFRDKPVLAQELYFPEVFGRTGGRIFEVTE